MVTLQKLIIILMYLLASDVKNEATDTSSAIFGGGCFWNLQYLFQHVSGVEETQCIYTEDGREAVFILFDKSQVKYKDLLKVFFRNINVHINYRDQYKPLIQCSEEVDLAEASAKILLIAKNKQAIAISMIGHFTVAEELHQNWYSNLNKTPSCNSPSRKFNPEVDF